jgi:peptidylglycine monooxygenase
MVHYTNVPQAKSAGVYMTATQGRFPPRKTTKAEAACRLNTDLTLHPFAFRVHTHGLGKVVTGWKVSPNMQWTLLGKDDPQLPQMFNPVADKSVTLTGGDILASRCTMYNDRPNEVKVGTTVQDEMCNFYLMYWVEGPRYQSYKTFSLSLVFHA